MSEAIQKKWAAIYANDEFICIQTCSGMRRTARDPSGELIFLSATPEPSELGRAVLAALFKSRVLTPEEIGSFFDVAAIEQRYENWVSEAMQKYAYATRRDLFKQMKHCLLECSGGSISLQPTFHEKLEAWSGKGIDKDDHVLVAETASEHEIGEGSLLALSRCVSR